jgi:uncharacterized membrane protein
VEGIIILFVLAILAAALFTFIACIVLLARTRQMGFRQGDIERTLGNMRGQISSHETRLRRSETPAPPPVAASAEPPEAEPSVAASPELAPIPAPPPQSVAATAAAPEVEEAPQPLAPEAEQEAAPLATPSAIGQELDQARLRAQTYSPGGSTPPPLPRAAESPAHAPAFAWAKIEKHLGERWMAYLGVVAIFLSVGFFIKYSIEQDWITRGMRVMGGLALGAVMMAAGVRFILRGAKPLGQALVGGGLGIIYLVLYAGFAYYEILPQNVAFASMALAAIVGLVLSVLCDALPISFLAVLGGFLTPRLCSTGHDARDILFAYILILDLSVLAVAWFKRWRALDVLAFVGTCIYFLGWYYKFYSTAALFPAMAWLGAFYLLFLILPFPLNLRRREHIRGERFALAMGNATGFFVMAYVLLHASHKDLLALVAVLMSAAYLVSGLVTSWRIPDDKRARLGFTALSITFLTLAIPLYFGLNGITIAWAAEGVVLVWLGIKYRDRLVRQGGALAIFLALIRLPFYHWDDYSYEGLTLYANPIFGVGLWCAVACGAAAFLYHRYREDVEPFARGMASVLAHLSGLLFMAVLYIDFREWIGTQFQAEWWITMVKGGLLTDARDCQLAAFAFLCALGAMGFLVGGLCLRSRGARVTMRILLGIGAVAVIRSYGKEFYGFYVLNGEPVLVMARDVIPKSREWARLFFLWKLSFAVGVFLAATIWATGFIRRRWEKMGPLPEHVLQERAIAEWHYLAFGYALMALLHVELNLWAVGSWVSFARVAVWCVGAVALLGCGFRRPAAWRLATLPALVWALVLTILAYGRFYDGHRGWPAEYDGMAAIWRCAMAGILVAAFIAHAWLLNRFASGATKEERNGIQAAYIGAMYLGLIVAVVELFTYTRAPWMWSLVAVLVAAGGMMVLVTGCGRSMAWRLLALPPMCLAVFFLFRVFHVHDVPGILLLNLRAMPVAVVLAILFSGAAILKKSGDGGRGEEQNAALLLSWSATLLLPYFLSVECYTFFRNSGVISDPRTARWMAHASLSILWSLYGMGLLCLGFWRRSQALRFIGLGFFGVTVMKAVFSDLWNLRELPRILAFLALGLLLIAGAYAYHKLEKRLGGEEELREDEEH